MIRLVDLAAQYAALKEEIDAAVSRVLASGRYVLGPEVEAFESEFAALCEVPFAVGVNSGTSALYLSLRAAGVGPGDEVVTVPFTFDATVETVRAVGARPRFVDIDPQSFTLDPTALEAAFSERTKAVVPVHLYGQTADLEPILDLSRQHGLTVIEDASQAHGATYKGRPVGGLGDLGCFSFYPTKNLSAPGEGGIIVTGNKTLADAARQLRSWGPVPWSGNFRMAALVAAVLRVKLPRLPAWTEKRRSIAARYEEQLNDTDLTLPGVMPYAGHVFHVYPVRSSRRDQLAEALRDRGIDVGVHYPQPLHLYPKYQDLGYQRGDFPVAEALANEELSLPIHPELSDEAVNRVTTAVKESLIAVRR